VFDTLAAEANFSYQMTSLCFHGHTHVPMIYEKQREILRVEPCKIKIAFGQKFFVNVGSVGQPRDGDQRSAYVLYCAKTKELDFIRVHYDVETAMEKNRLAGLPERLATRLAQGR
jgi:diadenosine tetraphosphatase ApaH/serine/threonine PP2A family protein phosphatase